MYLAGVSVRKVEDITEALWGTKVSPGIATLIKKLMNTSKHGEIGLLTVNHIHMLYRSNQVYG